MINDFDKYGERLPNNLGNDSDATQPLLAISNTPGLAPRPPRRRASRRPLWIALALLAVLLLGTSSALAAVGAIPLPFLTAHAPTATATATATATDTAMPSPTATNTATATATSRPTATATYSPGNPGPVEGVHLGCPAGVLHPYNFVVTSGSSRNEVALTFDDGPSPDYTSNILSTLEQTHTRATFFVVGAHVQQYPGLVLRAVKDGFGIGIHTWDHPDMPLLSPATRAWELGATANVIHAVVGANYCLPYWRPPYGDVNSGILAQTFGYGLSTIKWDDDPADWSAPGVQTIVNRVLSYAHPGAIILMHDGPVFRWQTAQALPQIIAGLKQRGLVPVTIPQLLGLPQSYLPTSPTPTPTSAPSPTPTNAPSPSPTALRPFAPSPLL